MSIEWMLNLENIILRSFALYTDERALPIYLKDTL